MKIEHARVLRAPEKLLPMAEALMRRTASSKALLEVRAGAAASRSAISLSPSFHWSVCTELGSQTWH